MPAPAPAFNNYSPIVDVVTTQQFMKGEFDNTKKRNVILRELEAKGNIRGDASGRFYEKNARVGTFQSTTRAELVERSFAQRQQRVTYAIPYAWMEVTGAIGEQSLVFNSGPEALIKLNAETMKDMGDDFRRNLAGYMLRNNAGTNTTFGQAVSNATPVPIFGLPTMFGYGAAAQNYNPDTQATSGAIAATDREALPNVTYCGVSTHPTNAIAGVDGKENESTSPVLINWSSTAFGGSTWKANALNVLDHLLTRCTRSEDPMDTPDLLLMTRTAFTDLSSSIVGGGPSGLGSRVVYTGESQSPNMKLFSDNKIPYGNAMAYWDMAQPANTVYALNTNYINFDYFPQKKYNGGGDIQGDAGSTYFGVRTDYDIKQGGHLAVAVLCANLWANPFYQGAAFNFA